MIKIKKKQKMNEKTKTKKKINRILIIKISMRKIKNIK